MTVNFQRGDMGMLGSGVVRDPLSLTLTLFGGWILERYLLHGYD